ncbi:hypothetical protein D3C79_491460 [compost metagenome]
MRDERFFAQCRELVAADLGADHTLQRPDRLMTGLDARLIALVVERGMHLARFDFAVLVVGVAGIDLDRTERTVQVTQFGGEAIVVLLHVQAHAGFGHGTVVAVVAAVGKAGVAVLPVIGAADCAAVLATVAVFQAVAAPRVIGVAHLRAACVSGDAQVVELAAVGVKVQGKRAVASFQLARAAAGGVGAAVAQFAGTVDAFDGAVGNAVVERVDHAADGVAAIEQGGGAANDLDPFDGDRIQRHGVVIRQRRGIEGAHAIAQDANAVAVQATDHRTAGAGTEPGGGDAGLLVEGFAQAAVLLLQQIVAFEHAAG